MTPQPETGPLSLADRAYRVLGNLVLTLVLVGFPLVAALSQLAGFASSDLNIAYRVANIVLCLVLLAWSLERRSFRLDLLIAGFLLLYSVRLLADLNYSSFPHISEDTQFFVATTLIPTIAIAGGRDWYDERTCLRLVLAIGGTGSLLILYILATGGGVTAEVATDTDRATLEFLNPISLGYQGLFTAVAALILLVRHRSRATIIPTLLGLAMGSYLLIISGSRGPFVALVAGALLTGAANRRANGVYVLAGAIAACLITYYGAPGVILLRFQDAGFDASSMDRVYSLQLSMDAALRHPLFGYAYIEPLTGLYPHNLLAEAGLAIGVCGFALMLWMQVSLIFQAWQDARKLAWWLPFLAAALFANAWISGSLWGSASFYVVLWILRDRRRLLVEAPSGGDMASPRYAQAMDAAGQSRGGQ